MFQLQAYSRKNIQSLRSVFLAPEERHHISIRVLLFTFCSISWIFWYSILKKAFVLHYYFSHSSKASEEKTTVIQFLVSLIWTEHQEMLLLHPDRSNKNTYKYTVWFTVLRLMEANIFIKLAISSSIQLREEHAPVYFCYLPSSKEFRNIYAVYQSVSVFLWSLYFPILSQIFGIQKGNHGWLLSTKCPPTQPICHTSASVLALTPTSIL